MNLIWWRNLFRESRDWRVVRVLSQIVPLWPVWHKHCHSEKESDSGCSKRPLRRRKKKMAHVSAVSPSHSSPPFTRLKPVEDKFQRMDATVKNVKTSVSHTSQTVGKDSGSEKEFSRSTSSVIRTVSDTRASQAKTLSAEQHYSSLRQPSRGREGDTSLSCRTSPVQDEPKQLNISSHVTSTNIPPKTSPQGLSREERLKLAKIKQENFRKKQMTERSPTVPRLSVTGDRLFCFICPTVVKFEFFHIQDKAFWMWLVVSAKIYISGQSNNSATLSMAGPGNSSAPCLSAFPTPPQVSWMQK